MQPCVLPSRRLSNSMGQPWVEWLRLQRTAMDSLASSMLSNRQASKIRYHLSRSSSNSVSWLLKTPAASRAIWRSLCHRVRHSDEQVLNHDRVQMVSSVKLKQVQTNRVTKYWALKDNQELMVEAKPLAADSNSSRYWQVSSRPRATSQWWTKLNRFSNHLSQLPRLIWTMPARKHSSIFKRKGIYIQIMLRQAKRPKTVAIWSRELEVAVSCNRMLHQVLTSPGLSSESQILAEAPATRAKACTHNRPSHPSTFNNNTERCRSRWAMMGVFRKMSLSGRILQKVCCLKELRLPTATCPISLTQSISRTLPQEARKEVLAKVIMLTRTTVSFCSTQSLWIEKLQTRQRLEVLVLTIRERWRTQTLSPLTT